MVKILIVDDSRMMRMILRSLLSQLKFNAISEASNGLEALTLIRENKIDIIFLDLHMPLLGGVGFLEQLRQIPEFQHTPVIIVSSDTEPKQLEKARSFGVLANLQKPMRLQDLQEALVRANIKIDYP